MRSSHPLRILAGLALILCVSTAYAANIGPDDRQISFTGAMGTPKTDAVTPAVAFDTALQRYLVVWSADETDGEFRIYGQLLSGAAGAPIAPVFQISPPGVAASDDRQPAVVYDPSSSLYLVVWSGDGLNPGAYEIMSQTVAEDGQLIGGAQRLSDMGAADNDAAFDAVTPDVAWVPGTGELIVVWAGDDDTGSLGDGRFEIYGQRLGNALATQIGVNDFRISTMGPDTQGNDALEPAVTVNTNSDEVAVAFEGDLVDDGVHTPAIYIQVLFEDAPVAPVAALSVVGSRNPDLIYAESSGEYVVAYDTEAGGGTPRAVYGRRTDSLGVIASTLLPFSNGAGAPFGEFREAVKPSLTLDPISGYWFVAWQADLNDGLIGFDYEVWGRRFNDVGGPVDAVASQLSVMDPVFGPVAGAGAPAVAANSVHDYKLIVWSGDRQVTATDEHEVFSQAWSDDAPSAVNDAPAVKTFVLHGAAPNPFNPATTIAWEMPTAAPVTLKIYDAAGRRVRTLLAATQHPAGRNAVVWDGRDEGGRNVAAGVYLYTLATPTEKATQRMSLVK